MMFLCRLAVLLLLCHPSQPFTAATPPLPSPPVRLYSKPGPRFDPFYTVARPILSDNSPAVPTSALSPLPPSPPTTSLSLDTSSTRSIYLSLLSLFRSDLALSCFLRVTNSILQVFPPLIIANILSLLALPTPPTQTLIKRCLLLFLVAQSKTTTENLYFQSIVKTSFKSTSLLRSHLFSSSLSSASPPPSNSLLAVSDQSSPQLSSLFLNVHTLYDAPLQILAHVLLIRRFLPASLPYLSLLLLTLPLNYVSSKLLRTYTKQSSSAQISLTGTLSSLLSNLNYVRSSPQYTASFLSSLSSYRSLDASARMKSGIVRSLIASVVTSLPSIVLALLVLSSSRSPAEIFPAIASLNSLRLPLLFLPGALNSIFVDSRVAAQRYNKEVNALSSRPAVTPTPANGEIRLDNVTSSFFRTPLDLSIAGGTVTAVVGAVGSGKSTFLSLVSALSPLSSGTLSAPPHLHRVPQSKWLPTFSFLPSLVTHPLPFDSALYSRVLAATSLDGDNAPLSLSSPSGGQASRLCVARALYAACVEGGFLLLDDVLGSLDPETRKAVWAGVLEMQAAYKFSLLVVNPPTPPPDCRTLLVEKGTVTYCAPPESCADDPLPPAPREPPLPLDLASTTPLIPEENPLTPTEPAPPPPSPTTASPPPAPPLPPSLPPPAPPLSSYITYFLRSKSPLLLFATLLSYVSSTFFSVSQQSTIASMNSPNFTRNLIGVTVLISFSQFARTLLTVKSGLAASADLFANMQRTLATRPLSFFYTTSPGSILSRFSNDLNTATTLFPDSVMWCIMCGSSILTSSLFIAGLLTSKSVLVIIAALSVQYSSYVRRYRPSQRRLKVQESKSRGPMNNAMIETLSGMESIGPSVAMTSYYRSKYADALSYNANVNWGIKNSDRWLSLRLESIGNLLVLAVSLVSVCSTAGQAKTGVVISQALGMVGLMNWSVRCATEAEQFRINVQRCEDIETPPPPPLPADDAAAALPLSPPPSDFGGDINFKNVGATYQKEPVLSNVDLTIPGGKSTGICGRSGSGKSTLLNSLLGLLPLTSGSISIDGADVLQHQNLVRQNVCYVNQGNGVFPGSLYFNLMCMADKTPENELIAWRALRSTSKRLHDKLRFFGEGALDVSLDDVGLSAGERALVQLARAVAAKMQNSSIKVVILDEATAAVDKATESDIQACIATEFAGCTRIVISHQLNNIEACDNVVVMGEGRVIEAGPPLENRLFQDLLRSGASLD